MKRRLQKRRNIAISWITLGRCPRSALEPMQKTSK